MSTVDLLSPQGTKTGTVELPPEIFDVQVNIPLIHQVVVAQLAAARQGTHDTKSRGEVSGGGRKPYRQKGTGRARQGSIRAPHYAGGGVVHGPTPRDYAQRTPKKMKAAALRGALSDRARSGRVHVVSGVVEGSVPSTRTAVALLAAITDRRNVLVVLGRDDALSSRSMRNAQGVHVLYADQLNTYDVLVSDDVVFTQDALEAFLAGPAAQAALAKAGAAPVVTVEVTAAPVESEPVEAEVVLAEAEPVEPVAFEAIAVEDEPVLEPAGAETVPFEPGPVEPEPAADLPESVTDAGSATDTDEVDK